MERYVKETNRLYGVLNKRLAGREYIAGEYSIADMASYPWIVPYERQQQNLEDFPHLKRWFETMAARPAVQSAYAVAQQVNETPTVTKDSQALLFRADRAMKRILYDLAAADEDLRFSPYCWRIKLALAHKNLSFETVPWRFTEKEAIAFSGQGKVPVLVDGDNVVADSQAIAEYLETAYPNEASLFGDAPARALTQFIKAWTEDVLHPAIAKIVLPDILVRLHPKDQPYFRETREKCFGHEDRGDRRRARGVCRGLQDRPGAPAQHA